MQLLARDGCHVTRTSVGLHFGCKMRSAELPHQKLCDAYNGFVALLVKDLAESSSVSVAIPVLDHIWATCSMCSDCTRGYCISGTARAGIGLPTRLISALPLLVTDAIS